MSVEEMVQKRRVVEIDSDEWNSFKEFCRRKKIEFKIIHDCGESVLAKMKVADLVRYVMFIELGEDDEDYMENVKIETSSGSLHQNFPLTQTRESYRFSDPECTRYKSCEECPRLFGNGERFACMEGAEWVTRNQSGMEEK